MLCSSGQETSIGAPKRALDFLSASQRAARQAVQLFASRRDVQLCGMLQVAFEVPLDLFVFLWAPGIPSEMNAGSAFAVLMTGLAAGSYFFRTVREACLYTYIAL